MKNMDYLKQKLHNMIDDLEYDGLYRVILDGTEPLCEGICKYCEPKFGYCGDNIDDDQICRNRFRQWCEMENNDTRLS